MPFATECFRYGDRDAGPDRGKDLTPKGAGLFKD